MFLKRQANRVGFSPKASPRECVGGMGQRNSFAWSSAAGAGVVSHDWSEEHPEIAAKLWTDFVRLVREGDGRGMVASSYLLRIARNTKDVDEYRAVADRLIEAHRRGLDP